MTLFMNLWEQIENRKIVENEDNASIDAIKTGLNIREDFWDDFLSLTNNREALAELLEIRPEQIANWPYRIKEGLDKVHKSSDDTDEEDMDTKIMHTGEL